MKGAIRIAKTIFLEMIFFFLEFSTISLLLWAEHDIYISIFKVIVSKEPYNKIVLVLPNLLIKYLSLCFYISLFWRAFWSLTVQWFLKVINKAEHAFCVKLLKSSAMLVRWVFVTSINVQVGIKRRVIRN